MKTTAAFRYFLACFPAFFILLSFRVSAGPLPQQTLAFVAKDSVWEAFRSRFPYHLQTIALSEPRADGSLVLVIAEPPPHAEVAEIEELFAGLSTHIETRRHSVGYDGWVQDLLCVVAAGDNQDQTLEATLLRLHRYLFFTEYKADFLYLERPAPGPEDRNWNLELSVTDLHTWLEKDEKFFPYAGGEARFLKSLLDAGAAGVYYSQKPGLVAWVLPKRENVSLYKKDARVFAIDADLIIGAMSGRKSVAILGRERLNELYTLPPLRTESILALAAAEVLQLGQSYERNQVFAGKYDDTRDWAPIFLSDELKNSELGSLLNLTDQLLKSWSCNGIIHYQNFEQYPTPEKWCFSRSIMEELGAKTLTFNWNTKGASFGISTGDSRDAPGYFALSRTGALPVSYIPNENNASREANESVGPYEDQAYACFAGWLDPNLVRVVQYTALFQIFRKYEMHADVPAAAPSAPPALEAEVLSGIERIGRAELESVERKTGLPMSTLEAYANKVKKGVAEVRKRFGEAGLRFMAGKIADENYSSDYPEGNAVINVLNTFYSECHFLLNQLCDKKAMRDKLAEAFREAGGPWIKTPSLVVSWAQMPERQHEWEPRTIITGGHNVGMDYPEFIPDPAVPVGQVIAEQGHYRNRFRINPADLSRLSPRVLRTANRIVKPDEFPELSADVQQALVNVPPRTPRSREEILPSQTRYAGRGYITQVDRAALLDQALLEQMRKEQATGKRSPSRFLLQLDKGDGSPGQEYAVVHTRNSFEIWTLNQSEITSRVEGLMGIRSIEIQQNKRSEERSTKTIVFARVDGFAETDETVTFHIGSSEFSCSKTELVQALEGKSDEILPWMQAFYDHTEARFPSCKQVVFQADEWLNGHDLHDKEGAVPVIRNILPGVHFINPHRLASLLARHRPASRERAFQIGLCRSNMALALENAEQLPNVKGVQDVGLVLKTDQYLSEDQMVAANLVAEFKKVGGQVFSLDEGLMFEGRHFILVTGVKSEAFRQQLADAARNGQLRGKSLILASCYEKFEQNELEFNSSVLLGEGGARGVYLYDSRINLQHLRYVLFEFFQVLKDTKKNSNFYELFYRSIESAAKAKPVLKAELERFWKGIFQYSVRDEDGRETEPARVQTDRG